MTDETKIVLSHTTAAILSSNGCVGGVVVTSGVGSAGEIHITKLVALYKSRHFCTIIRRQGVTASSDESNYRSSSRARSGIYQLMAKVSDRQRIHL